MKHVKSALAATALALLLSTSAFAADTMGTSQNDMNTSAKASTSGTNMQMDMDGQAKTGTDMGYQLTLSFAKTPVKTGQNDFTVTLKNKDGKPVSGASITATIDMNTEGMASMNMSDPIQVTLTDAGNGLYTGSASLSDAGDWFLNASGIANGTSFSQKLDFTVQDAGPNLYVIGGFGGAIVLILVIALIVKKKNRK